MRESLPRSESVRVTGEHVTLERIAGQPARGGGSNVIDLTDRHLDLRNDPHPRQASVAVLVPCRNEEAAVGKVVSDFRAALPAATVYVYDNASTDDTAVVAAAAGAVVRHVRHPGKGNVMRQMFRDIDADIYIIVDGDDTYDAGAAPVMLDRLLDEGLDMVVGRRVEHADSGLAYRRGHRLGNTVLTSSVRWLFGHGPTDMLSGYRVMSRQFVKSFPSMARGFEIETEMTVHALELRLPVEEVATMYRARPDDSASKLRTIPDGIRILRYIVSLSKDYRPMRFFGLVAALGALVALVALATAGKLDAWTPATMIAAICGLTVFISLLAGVVLNSLGRNALEIKRMLYLSAGRAH